MKSFCAVFLGFAIIQAIPVESGSMDGFGSASAVASGFWNGPGGNIMQTGSSPPLASARKNDISIDVDISQLNGMKKKSDGFNFAQQSNAGKETGFSLEIGGANNQFKSISNKGNMNEHELHHHISQYIKNLYSGSTSGNGHGHGHHSTNDKSDVSIDVDISANQNTNGKNMQQQENFVGFVANNPNPDTQQNGSKDDKKISLDIDLDTDGDGKADQKINVDIDTKSDEKDLGRERNMLKSDDDAHMVEKNKDLKKGKVEKTKIKKQKNKYVRNVSRSTTTNHYHAGPNTHPPVFQFHMPPTMAVPYYSVPHFAQVPQVPLMPAMTTHNSMNAAASSLSLQSTTVPNGAPYIHPNSPTMPGYGPMPTVGMNMYGHADATVRAQSGTPSYGLPPNSFNHVPNMQSGPYGPMHGTQNYFGQGLSSASPQQSMPQQYTQTQHHH